jgi:hypothetical protein
LDGKKKIVVVVMVLNGEVNIHVNASGVLVME